MVRGPSLIIVIGLLAACSGGARNAPGPQDPVPPEFQPQADADASTGPVEAGSGVTPQAPTRPPPAGARAIRNLPWEGVDCTADTPLDRTLRLDYAPARGWSCQVERTTFADVTGDQIEEAIVSLRFQLAVVERHASGETSERRLRGEEYVVVSLRQGQPELLVHAASSQGDITNVQVEEGDLRVELQGCWDCGCDELLEIWHWDGHRFVTDEARSEVLYEAPDCESP